METTTKEWIEWFNSEPVKYEVELTEFEMEVALRNDAKVRFKDMPKAVQEEMKKQWNGLKGEEANITYLDQCTDSLDAWYAKPHYATFDSGAIYRLRKPSEYVPEGYRFVTEEEREEFGMPHDSVKYFSSRNHPEWRDAIHSFEWNPTVLAYAVPKDFVFKKPEPKVLICNNHSKKLPCTVSDCDHKGCPFYDPEWNMEWVTTWESDEKEFRMQTWQEVN